MVTTPSITAGATIPPDPVAAAVEDLWRKRRVLIARARKLYAEAAREDDFETYEAAALPSLKQAWAMAREFVKLPHSLNKLGALMLCALEEQSESAGATPNDPVEPEVQRTIEQLKTLAPFLTGLVGQDVRELLGNPDRPIGDLPCIFP
jgi:hypothetical protein